MVRAQSAYPIYPSTALGIAFLAVARRRRSFRRDAARLVPRLQPPLCFAGTVPRLQGRGWLIVVNHYSRPGFRAWWIPMVIATVLPSEVHWVMTDTLTYPDRVRAATITPASRWLLHRIGRLYDFSTMPPMPPRPFEVDARALAVRRVLRYVRRTPNPVIGLAPEGGDMPSGVLAPPAAGSGRFMAHLVRHGLCVLPFGAYEEDGALYLRVGTPFDPSPVPPGSAEDRDRAMADQVMGAIARCLPHRLRGAYA
jgi:hypothetical protein